MESVNSVVNSQKESLSEQSLEAEKQNLELDGEEQAIKEMSQKISSGIQAKIVINLGEKLLIQGEERFGKINPENSSFYNWAENLTDTKKSTVNEYIELYKEFKDFQYLIRPWMNKSHLNSIKKYSSRRKINKEIAINFLINLDENKDIKLFRREFLKKGSSHISAQLFDEMLSYSPQSDLTSQDALTHIFANFKRFSETYLSATLSSYSTRYHGEKLDIPDNCELNRKVKDLISFEPIDEQSFVGLFCLMFFLLKENHVIIVKGKEEFSFEKIDYIGVKFPDAKIQFRNTKTNLPADPFAIEFEFESSRYITHRHYEQREECHMIICWKDNLKNEDFINFRIPPVFAIEKLLKEGNNSVRFYSNL